MRIISKFKDYYDGVSSLGIDNSVHYLRETKVVPVDGIISKVLTSRNSYNLNNNYSSYTYRGNEVNSYKQTFMFFCGTLYPILIINCTSKKLNSDIREIIYGYDECLKFFKTNGDYSANKLKNIYESLTNDIILNEHVKYSAPILFYHVEYNNKEWSVTINKKLKDIKLYKIIDPFTCFQEISMFLNSTLCDVSTPKMPVGDDNVILNSKGFDPKYGFRTRPK